MSTPALNYHYILYIFTTLTHGQTSYHRDHQTLEKKLSLCQFHLNERPDSFFKEYFLNLSFVIYQLQGAHPTSKNVIRWGPNKGIKLISYSWERNTSRLSKSAVNSWHWRWLQSDLVLADRIVALIVVAFVFQTSSTDYDIASCVVIEGVGFDLCTGSEFCRWPQVHLWVFLEDHEPGSTQAESKNTAGDDQDVCLDPCAWENG